MKKNIIYTIVLVMSITMAHAQLKGGAGFFKTGYLYAPGSSNILKNLSPAGRLGYSNSYFIMGVEAYYRKGNNILGADLYSGEQADYYFATNSYSNPYLGSTHIKFGRIIRETKQHWVYPSVGFGANGIVLATYNRENDKSTNVTSQTLVSPSADIGINEDIILNKMDSDEKTIGGLILGIRIGYSTCVNSTKWNNVDLNKKRSYSNNYFYLSISIGSGGFVSK